MINATVLRRILFMVTGLIIAGSLILGFLVIPFVRMVHTHAKAPVLVFEHANLIDGISDTPQRDMTVIVAEGKIIVVSAARISPPANAQRFDLSSRWLLPGFIDAHIHPNNIKWVKKLACRKRNDDGPKHVYGFLRRCRASRAAPPRGIRHSRYSRVGVSGRAEHRYISDPR